MDDTKVTTEQAISLLEKRLEQRPTPGERVVFSMALSAMRTQQEKKTGGWISVKDRIPDKPGDYIVYYQNTASGKPLISMRHFYGEIPEAFLHNKAMTHWMPMPEPPEEGGTI